jgi:hypothetical protein
LIGIDRYSLAYYLLDLTSKELQAELKRLKQTPKEISEVCNAIEIAQYKLWGFLKERDK